MEFLHVFSVVFNEITELTKAWVLKQISWVFSDFRLIQLLDFNSDSFVYISVNITV